MKPAALIVAALAAFGLTVLSVLAYANLPHRTSCLVAASGDRQQLYFGSPGASAKWRATSCEFQFMSDAHNDYVRFSAGPLTYTAKLSPFTTADQIEGADSLPSAGGNTLRCHTSGAIVSPGGIFACSFSFWQLVPKSDGVVVRLQRGKAVSSYLLTPASLPSHAARRVFW